MARGVRNRVTQAPGYGAFGNVSFNPSADEAIRYIDAVAAFSHFGIRFPFNDASSTSLTTSGGEELDESVNLYDELIINKPLRVTANPCLIFARRVQLATNTLQSSTASAGTGADSGAIPGSTLGAWTNPGNITSSNNSDATSPLGSGVTRYLLATNFGFAVPSSAVVRGIKVSVEGARSATAASFLAVKLIIGGTVQDGNLANGEALTGTDAVYEFGSSTATWGTGHCASNEVLTPAVVNASTFGVALAFNTTSSRADIDHVQITVYYYDGGMIWADGLGSLGSGGSGARPSGAKVNATAGTDGWKGYFSSTAYKAYPIGVSSGGGGASGTVTGAGGDAADGGDGGPMDEQTASAAGGTILSPDGSDGIASASVFGRGMYTIGDWLRWLQDYRLGPGGGGGGGGGGGSASTTVGRNGSNGGDGGGAGPQIWIACEVWDNQGLVSARGGDGYTSEDMASLTNTADGVGGPGGGGGGGLIKVMTQDCLNEGTFDVSGGIGGPSTMYGVVATTDTGSGGDGSAGFYDVEATAR